MEPLTQLALDSERVLRADVAQMATGDPAVAKTLLVRGATEPFAAQGPELTVCESEEQWRWYEDQRVTVEAGFGLDQTAAREMVRHMRGRAALLGMRLWLAKAETGEVVGGIAAFRCPGQPPAARLQEVDVFPAHRGRGFGKALLEGARRLLVAEGVQTLVIGADEDDWPLAWYRSLEFRDVLRVDRRA